MPNISAIEPGRRRGRFNIYVNGQFAAAAGEKTIAELNIRLGQEFTSERLAQIAQGEETRRAVETAARMLESRPRSSSEIVQRLRQKGYEDETIQKVVEKFKEMALIDDAEFARQWVESRGRVRPKGARALRTELMQKGVAREEIDEAVAGVSPDDELDLARKALQSKLRGGPLPEERDARRAERQRLAMFLQRRGFGWDTVKVVLAEVFDTNEDEEVMEE